MKKQIRIPIPHGSARVDEDCPKEVIEALHKLANLVYEMPTEQLNKLPVMRPASASAIGGELLPAEGSAKGVCAGGGKHLATTARKVFGMRKCRKCGNLF